MTNPLAVTATALILSIAVGIIAAAFLDRPTANQPPGTCSSCCA